MPSPSFNRMMMNLVAGAGVAPTTVNFTETQVLSGYQGFFDTTTNAARRVWQQRAGQWMGFITGTDASMFATGGDTTPYNVVVDDGAVVTPVLSGGKITLFAGLSQGVHKVLVYPDNGTSGSTWTPTTGTLISVTGQNPAIDVVGQTYYVKDPSFPGFETYPQVAAFGGNFTPNYLRPSAAGTGWLDNYGSLHFRARFNDIYICTDDNEAWYSIDGGAWTKTALTAAYTNVAGTVRTWRKLTPISGDAGSTYREIILGSGQLAPAIGGIEAVRLTGATASMLAPTVSKSQVTLLGASQVAGLGATPGSVDIFRLQLLIPSLAAQQLGYSGKLITEATTAMPTIAAALKTKATIILSIGINSPDDANLQSDYQALINATLTAGFTKVMCRGLFQQSASNTSKNGKIAAAVAAVADVRVTYLDCSSFTMSTDGSVGIWMPDGAHENDVGYQTLAGLENTLFGASLP